MQDLFNTLGLDSKETGTFLTLLKLGSQPISIVAKYVGMPRSSMYVVLGRLQQAQLVEIFERSGVRFAKCISPAAIRDILLARERKIGQDIAILEKYLPELERLESTLSVTPHVRFFEGKEAVMRMYEEILQEKQFSAFFNPALMKRLMPEYYLTVPTMLREKNGYAKELLTDSVEARKYQKTFQSERHQIKIFPKRVQFPSDTILGHERVSMVAYGEHEISACEIRSSSLAATQQALFEELWRTIT